MKKFNPFHLVNQRPWPLTTSLSFITFALGLITIVHTFNWKPFICSLLILLVSSFLWGRDVHREGCYEGNHNLNVREGFKIGIIFFILSECFFFLGIFWAYIHLAESPSIYTGNIWPPLGIITFDPKGIPFLNTILLVSSGVSVTWCHHCTEKGELKESINSILITLTIGLTFTRLQIIEYYVAGFTFSCSAYSSVYFIGTGFHGIHVIIGRGLLIIRLYRFIIERIRPYHNTGFECAVWYWHFVDVVWFCLYLIFYWWGV